MSKKFEKLERVEAVLNNCTPDRPPIYDLLRNDSIIEHFSGSRLDGSHDFKSVCEAIGACLDMTRSIRVPSKDANDLDVAMLEAKDKRAFSVATQNKDELQGFSYSFHRWTEWISKRPFNDLDGGKKYVEQSIQYRKNKQPTKEYILDYREKYKAYEEYVNGTVVLHDPSAVGLDFAYTTLTWDLFALMMYEEPEMISEWLEVLCDCEIRRTHAIAEKNISPVVLVYADIAGKNGVMFSPKFLRKDFIPHLDRLVEAWHEHNIKVLFHSDGDLNAILDDIVGTGIDGLNPLEKTPGMDIFTVHDTFKDRIFLAGGVDVNSLLVNGTPQEVTEGTRNIMASVDNKRLFVGSTTETGNDVPLENFKAMYDTVVNN